VAELETVLRSSLARNPRISFDSLRVTANVPPLDLGTLASPLPPPRWEDFVPRTPRGPGRILGGVRRYQESCEAAERTFSQALEAHKEREAARQAKVASARADWSKMAVEAKQKADAHNARIDALEAGFRKRDRFAVSEYVQLVLARSPYPGGFPAERHSGYVPESSLLAVEWFLPAYAIIPEHKAFRHVKARKAVEPVSRPPADAQRLYKSVIAQIAVRTIHEVFTATPADMVSTVVFNGHVDAVDPATGGRIRPP
jgi:restriction system protein